MTLVTRSDPFTGADGTLLNIAGGSWIGTTSGATIQGNQATAGPTNTMAEQHIDGFDGPQTSQVTLKTLGADTTKAWVGAGMPARGVDPGTWVSLFSGTPWYRWNARSTNFLLQRKNDGTSAFTTVATYATAPVVGDVIKITFDPATGVVKGFVNGVERATYTDPSPVTGRGIGFGGESGSAVDDWSGTWDVPGGDTGGWGFSVWSGGVAPVGSEIPLTVEGVWNGSTVVPLNVPATSIHGGDTSGLPLVQPLWSDMVRDGFGVNVHYKFGGSSSNVHFYMAQITAYLIELGCGWIRDRLVNPGQNTYSKQWAEFAKLAAAGVGLHVSLSQDSSVGWQNTTQAHYNRYWDDIAAHPDWKWSTGGPNEPNNSPPANWPTLLRNVMQMHFNTRNAKGMSHVPVLAPALWEGSGGNVQNDFAALGATDIYQYVTHADFHRYPLGKQNWEPNWPATQPDAGGRTPEFLMDFRIAWARAAYRTNNVHSTEGGYNTDLTVTAGGEHVPDDIDAYYKERHLLSLIRKGVTRFYLYELMDDPDPHATNPDGTIGNAEAHRGLIFTPALDPATWVRKPAFNRLKSLMATVRDVGGGFDPVTNPFVPPQVRLRVTSADPTFRHLVTAKRDGTVRVFYWLDKALWDTATDTRIGSVSGEITHEKIGNLPTGVLPGGTSGNTLSESSGFTCSRQHSNLVWCHNDSNADHLVFGLDYSAGMAHRKTLRMTGDGFTITEHAQMEDCAIDPTTNRVWIANSGTGTHEFTAYRFDEPASLGAAGTVLDVTTQRFRFAWGSGAEAYNCEAMMIDPAGRLYFIPKHNNVGNGTDPAQTGLWQAPASLGAWPAVNTLTKLGTIGAAETPSFQIGGADWAPDNSMFCVIKCATQIATSVETITTKRFNSSAPWGADHFAGTFPLHVSHRSNGEVGSQENIAFLPDSSGLLVAVETPGAEVWLTRFGQGVGISSPFTIETPGGTLNMQATPIVQSVVVTT